MKSDFNFNHLGSIESIIDSIAGVLTLYSPAGTTVKKESPKKGKSCKGIISVTSLQKRQEYMGLSSAQMTEGPISSNQTDPTATQAAKPVTVTYAFYPSTSNPSQLGSVAIYADDTALILSGIRRRKSLFGFKVINAVVEYGRRPFIDVTLRN